MSGSTVRRRGTDSSGRGIYASDFMWNWWRGVCDELGFEPTIVQGAWMSMNGGGAKASAGYHDYGGCFDLRVWNLTSAQQNAVIRVTRARGAGSWIRDKTRGGMDPHIHLVLGSDFSLASGAAWQWSEYRAGRNGLASRGRDYHPRPVPLVLRPPKREWDELASKREVQDAVRAVVREELNQFFKQKQSNGASIKANIRRAGNVFARLKKEKVV